MKAIYELDKKDKKIARIAIDKGLNAKYREGIEKLEAIILEWRKGILSNKDTYLEMYKSLEKCEEEIEGRYGDLRGSHYLETVAAILYENYINEDDIKELSVGAKEVIQRWILVWR